MATLREFADKIRDVADIVSVIGSYIPLKHAGANHRAICPFHQEKKPSFMVSPSKQIFHCFGCGTGGDVISFVMKFEKVEFREALEILANKLGIPLPEFRARSYDQEVENYKNTLYELHNAALKFFVDKLNSPEGRQAERYLKKRGVDDRIVTQMAIGYAPAGWETLKQYLQKKGFSPKAIEDSGLVAKHPEKSSSYDRFRNRLIFPIMDHLGRCVGFGGRTLGDAEPVYLNSSDSLIYRKGQMLYGLNWAKDEISKQGFVIIVEGYFDFITVFQFGFENVVATLGTALTAHQARLLKRYCGKIVFIFDPDEAGQQAMLRGSEVLLAQDLEVKVVVLAEKEDPDSFLHKHGPEGFAEQLKEQKDLVEFLVFLAKDKFDLDTARGKVEALELFRPLLKTITNPIIFQDHVRQLAEALKLEERLIQEYVKATSEAKQGMVRQEIDEQAGQGMNIWDKALIRLLIDYPAARQALKSKVDIGWINDERAKKWIEWLLDAEEGCSLGSMIDCCDSEEEACLIREIALWEEFGDKYDNVLAELPCKMNVRYRRNKCSETLRNLTQIERRMGTKELERQGEVKELKAHLLELIHHAQIRLEETRRLLGK